MYDGIRKLIKKLIPKYRIYKLKKQQKRLLSKLKKDIFYTKQMWLMETFNEDEISAVNKALYILNESGRFTISSTNPFRSELLSVFQNSNAELKGDIFPMQYFVDVVYTAES
jgi:hypothetical protein